MKPCFIDANVVLGLPAPRQPHGDDAAYLTQAGLRYPFRKQVVTSAAVDAAMARRATGGPFIDFGAGVRHDAAGPASAPSVARSQRDFAANTPPVLLPAPTLIELAA